MRRRIQILPREEGSGRDIPGGPNDYKHHSGAAMADSITSSPEGGVKAGRRSRSPNDGRAPKAEALLSASRSVTELIVINPDRGI